MSLSSVRQADNAASPGGIGRRVLLTSTWLAAAAGLLAGVAGCSPGGDLQPVPDFRPQAYRLGAGDQVRIITFGEDELTGEFGIDDQGRIAVPLLGSVEAAGLTPQQLTDRVASDLRRKNVMPNPSIAIEVIAYRPIFVLGEVAKPGQYPYRPRMTMLTAVAVAGGFTYRAYEDYASVVRTVGNEAEKGLIQPQSFVAPGDVIRVFERSF